ncbi:MAG: YhgE/Pip domain-containing protein [Corynebacterium sp.]|nr:YhgE/Pip domain-containing protein [Corynebacterium sp.]
MISASHVGTELKRFKRDRLARVAITAIAFLPLLYSTLYLWAFWNPFGNLEHMPIALVNSDEGATVDGEKLDAGAQIVDALHDNDELHWITTDASDADAGVREGRYYFALELPENFSSAVASVDTDDPHQAQLRVTYNDANGYLSTMIGQNAMREVQLVISDQLSAQVVDQILLGVVDAGTGLSQAADGAGQLAEGATQLDDGLVELRDGSATLHTKLGEASSGAHQISSGADQLAVGANTLAGGAGQLAAGTQQLDTAVTQATGRLGELTSGLGELSTGVEALGAGATQLNAGVQELQNRVDDVTAVQTNQAELTRQVAAQLRTIPGATTQQLAAQLDEIATAVDTHALGKDAYYTARMQELSTGMAQLTYQLADANAPLRSGITQLQTGTGAIPDQINQLTSGVSELNAGAQQLATGSNTLAANMGTLASSTTTLADGIEQLESGAFELNQGLVTAEGGSSELADGAVTLQEALEDGAKQVPDWNEDQRLSTATVVGGPVDLASQNDAGDNTFGRGLAPFFFSLGLYIGAIAIYFLLRPLQNRAVASGVTPLRAALDGLWPSALIGLFQGSIVMAVTTLTLDLNPAYPISLWLFSMAASVMFIAINQFFIAALGTGPGRVISMVFLMLQLLACGGLYPVEVEPKIFQWFHPINPMTYTVNGFRQLAYGTLDERLPIAVAAVLFITALFISLTALCARRDRNWTIKRLHPAINV